MASTPQLLVRICVGKITNPSHFEILVNSVTVPPLSSDKSWNCVRWTREVLERLDSDRKVVKGEMNWMEVRSAAMGYVERKAREGRFTTSPRGGVATFDLLERGGSCCVEPALPRGVRKDDTSWRRRIGAMGKMHFPACVRLI